MPTGWQERLRNAASETEVVGVVRDYAATLSPVDLERLPEPCRPRTFLRANDVTNFAFTLVRHDCAVEGAAARIVGKLANFFADASVRLSQIMARGNAHPDD